MKTQRSLSFLGALSMAVLACACQPVQKKPEVAPPAPQIESFTSSATVVDPGASVTLAWSVKDAAKVEVKETSKGVLSGVDSSALSGSVDVTIDQDSLFVLTAANSRGTRESKAVWVTTTRPAKDVLFTASPSKVAAGEHAVLAWIARGARTVSLADKDGNAIDVGTQVEAGSVEVNPNVTTSYTLTVDGVGHDALVEVGPSIGAFVAAPSSAVPGQPLALSWQTVGATKVTVSAAGTGEVHAETDPAIVSDGTFSVDIPASVAPASVLTYILRAESASGAYATTSISVYVAGEPAVSEFKAPEYALAGGTFEVSWKTANADAVELLQDGVVVFRQTDAAQVQSGTLTLNTPAQDTTLILRASWSRGGKADSDPKVVSPVGVPTVMDFTATPGGIANGGEVVTLTWNVPNARDLTIVATSQYEVTHLTGVAAETGTMEVYPNKDTEFVLTANNTIGDAITPAIQNVTVTTPARLVFSPEPVPVGASVQLTGSTVPNGGVMRAFNFATKNDPNDAFVDISTTGDELIYSASADTESHVATFAAPFTTKLFGNTLTADGVNISINGWMSFGTTAISGSVVPSSTLPSTTYEPLVIAVWGDDLQATGTTHVYWQIDGTGPTERLIVQWNDVRPYASSGKSATFQAQVYANGEIVFAYQNVTGMTSSDLAAIGVQDSTRTRALQVRRDQFANTYQPASGDTFHLFGTITLPTTLPASTTPYLVQQEVGNGVIYLENGPQLLGPNDLWISEVNYYPAAGKEEWIELSNGSAAPLDLNGWILDFGAAGQHQIAQSLVVPPQGRILLGQSPDSAEASLGGPAIDYVYGSAFALPDTSGSLKLSFLGGVQHTYSYSVGTAGLARVADPPRTDLKYASGTQVTCAGTGTYGSGQTGSPGAANPRCFQYDRSSSTTTFQSIAATGTALPGLINTTTSELTVAVALGRPVMLFGNSYSNLYVSSNGWISVLSTTLTSSSNPSLPSTSAPNGVLAPYWDDLVGNGTGSGVYWEQFDPDGTPASGDEYTLVSWENWKSAYTTPSSLNFQVKFHEATGDVEYVFGTMYGSSTYYAQGGSATTWLENLAGNIAAFINVNSTTAPGIQENTAFRFTYVP